LAVGLIAGLRYFKPLFVAVCLFIAWGASMTILNAFTADPALWPSAWTRYAGVLINLIGVAGAILGIVGMAKRQSA